LQVTGWKEKPTVSVPEYARIMGISKSLAFKLAGEGKIPGLLRLGEKRMVVSTQAIIRTLDEAAGE
jgi:predicted DNA-binding transcriptional regulator AlpA